MFIFPPLLFSPILHSSIDILLLFLIFNSRRLQLSLNSLFYSEIQFFSFDLESFVYCFIRFLCGLFAFAYIFSNDFSTSSHSLTEFNTKITLSTTHNRNRRACYEIKDCFVRLRNHCQFYRIQKQFYTILMLQFFTI